MKTKLYNLVVAASVLLLASCEKDFFDTNSPSAMDVSVFKSAEMVEQTVGGIYNIFGEQNSFRSRLAILFCLYEPRGADAWLICWGYSIPTKSIIQVRFDRRPDRAPFTVP